MEDAFLKGNEKMGLDVQLFDRDRNELRIVEIEPQLHHVIFLDTKNWRTYKYLRNIKDYYTSNIYWDKEELKGFIHDLKSYRKHINQEYLPHLNSLIDSLSAEGVESIRITGD
jgi:hypothetical protein